MSYFNDNEDYIINGPIEQLHDEPTEAQVLSMVIDDIAVKLTEPSITFSDRVALAKELVGYANQVAELC